MRALYIYSKHDLKQLELIKRVKIELQGYLEIVEFEECPEILKRIVRETPALISAEEHLQGYDSLLKETVDGHLLITAEMYKKIDNSEKALLNVNNERLDSFVKHENVVAVDNYTLELIEGGYLV